MGYIYRYRSPLGPMTMASDGEALTGLWFDGQRYFGATLTEDREEKLLPVFETTVRWLDVYFGGQAPDFTPPLSLRGAAFRLAVWEETMKIPFGQTAAYGELALTLARQRGYKPHSARPVGAALGRNPISIIIPCHRVVGAGGKPVGYAAGTNTKLHLLFHEKKALRDRQPPRKNDGDTADLTAPAQPAPDVFA